MTNVDILLSMNRRAPVDGDLLPFRWFFIPLTSFIIFHWTFLSILAVIERCLFDYFFSLQVWEVNRTTVAYWRLTQSWRNIISECTLYLLDQRTEVTSAATSKSIIINLHSHDIDFLIVVILKIDHQFCFGSTLTRVMK